MKRLASAALVSIALGIAAGARAEDGLQVEVDPRTGAYSMPAPGRLPDTAPRAVAGDDVVITPGRTAAGGFKATRRDVLAPEQSSAPPATDVAPPPVE